MQNDSNVMKRCLYKTPVTMAANKHHSPLAVCVELFGLVKLALLVESN